MYNIDTGFWPQCVLSDLSSASMVVIQIAFRQREQKFNSCWFKGICIYLNALLLLILVGRKQKRVLKVKDDIPGVEVELLLEIRLECDRHSEIQLALLFLRVAVLIQGGWSASLKAGFCSCVGGCYIEEGPGNVSGSKNKHCRFYQDIPVFFQFLQREKSALLVRKILGKIFVFLYSLVKTVSVTLPLIFWAALNITHRNHSIEKLLHRPTHSPLM